MDIIYTILIFNKNVYLYNYNEFICIFLNSLGEYRFNKCYRNFHEYIHINYSILTNLIYQQNDKKLNNNR